jgi:hypothetical protein
VHPSSIWSATRPWFAVAADDDDDDVGADLIVLGHSGFAPWGVAAGHH